MATIGENMGYIFTVPSVIAQADGGAPQAGTWISMRNFKRATALVQIGGVVNNLVIDVDQATDVAGTGAQALNFSHLYRCASRLYFDPATRNAVDYVVGEAVTGAGGGAVVIHSIHADHLVVHSWDNAAFIAGAVITGAGGAQATLLAANFHVDLDIMTRYAVLAGDRVAPGTLNQYIPPNTLTKMYAIEIDASDIADGFSAVRVGFSASGTGSEVAVTYILTGARYAGSPHLSVLSD